MSEADVAINSTVPGKISKGVDKLKRGVKSMQDKVKKWRPGAPEGTYIAATHDELRQLFDEVDKNKNGKLDEQETQELFELLELEVDKPIEDMIAVWDETGDGKIDFDEFCAMFYPDYDEFDVIPASHASAYNPCASEADEHHRYNKGLPYLDTSFDPKAGLTKKGAAVRAPKLVPKLVSAKLFDHIDPHDINQGDIEDCWLMCAFASMAEFPGLIQQCFKEKQRDPHGKYEMKIWDGKQWNGVVVSDLIPVFEQHHIWNSHVPRFATPQRGEIWVMLLEKAVAKWVGGYENLNGGYPVCCWRALTGRDDCLILLQDECPDEYDPGTWTMHIPTFYDAKVFEVDLDEGVPVDLWDYLVEWEEKNALVGAMDAKDDARSAQEGYEIREDGIVTAHCYTILQLAHFKEHELRLVQLRNPWGCLKEWKGAWSDEAKEWKTYPDVAKELNVKAKDDGMFWMTIEDFVEVFTRVEMCPNDAPIPRRANISPHNAESKPFKRPKRFPCGAECSCQ